MNIVAVLTILPLLVVLTNMLTNVVKGLNNLFAAHAKLVALLVGEVVTVLAVAAFLQAYGITPVWYYYAGGVIGGGVVAYVAMNGYDGLYEELVRLLKGLGGTE